MPSSAVKSVAKSLLVTLCLGASLAPPAPAQGGGAASEVLTNESITQMIAGKVPKDLILTKIHSTRTAFDVTPAGLVGLHASKVSDDVLKAMIQAAPSGAPKEAMDNDAIIKMVTGLLSKEIILLKIQGDRADYDLTTNGIIRLNQNKVSQDVIKAMMAATSSTPAAPSHRP
jgi:hypothetical protein